MPSNGWNNDEMYLEANQYASESVKGLPATHFMTLASSKTESLGWTKVRQLTLLQLWNTIREIYEEKQMHDQICRESQLPYETLEQFMYTFLSHKYGLKPLIMEWAAMIVSSCWVYIEDPEIMLFAKMLKNECEENFWHGQRWVWDAMIKSTWAVYDERFVEKNVKSAMAMEIENMVYTTNDYHLFTKQQIKELLESRYDDIDISKIEHIMLSRHR